MWEDYINEIEALINREIKEMLGSRKIYITEWTLSEIIIIAASVVALHQSQTPPPHLETVPHFQGKKISL